MHIIPKSYNNHLYYSHAFNGKKQKNRTGYNSFFQIYDHLEIHHR